MAPREAELILSSYVHTLGTSVWYTGTPRVFKGQNSFPASFLEFLPEPITLITYGMTTFESDVTVDLLRNKVTEIIMNGM